MMEKIESNEPIDESWWASLLATEETGTKKGNSNNGNGHRNGETFHDGVRQPTGPATRTEPRHTALTADQEVDWDQIQELMANEDLLTCEVIEFNRGGLLVNTQEFKGFIPVSHLSDLGVPESPSARDNFLKAYLDRELSVKVIECDPERGRIVLSERAAQTPPGQRQQLFENLHEDDRLNGVVTNITDFGIFVDLGGVEGLVHISEISWGRVVHPADFVSVGSDIEVQVLQIDRRVDKISLSIKRLLDNPWLSASDRFPLGSEVEVIVTEVVKFGAFARVEDGLEGLIHISEMNLNGYDQPADILAEGEIVTAEIISIDPDHQRLSLRLKH